MLYCWNGSTLLLLSLPQLTYLPPPWGDCKATPMDSDFFSSYSITACRIDCETRYLVENCNCRMVHMPGRVSFLNCRDKIILKEQTAFLPLVAEYQRYSHSTGSEDNFNLCLRSNHSWHFCPPSTFNQFVASQTANWKRICTEETFQWVYVTHTRLSNRLYPHSDLSVIKVTFDAVFAYRLADSLAVW